MIHKKRSFQLTMLAALLCGAPLTALHAQNPGDGHPRAPHDPPPSPLFDALDTNHDGVISAVRNRQRFHRAQGLAQKRRLPKLPAKMSVRRIRPVIAMNRARHVRIPARNPSGHINRSPPMIARPMTPVPPRLREDVEPADHTFHRPPPRAADDDQATDEHARPHPPLPEGADRPDAEAERPHPFRDGAAEHPRHPHASPSPLFDALDTNHDGVISADEIANAAESLKKLDKAGSGQIRREGLETDAPTGQQRLIAPRPARRDFRAGLFCAAHCRDLHQEAPRAVYGTP